MRLNRLKRQLKKVYLKGFVVVVSPSPLECFHYTEGSKTCLARCSFINLGMSCVPDQADAKSCLESCMK